MTTDLPSSQSLTATTQSTPGAPSPIAVPPTVAEWLIWALLPMLLRWRLYLMRAHGFMVVFFPTWERVGCYIQDVLVWCIAFAVFMPLVRRDRPNRRLWAIVAILACNVILLLDMVDVQCKVAFMQPLTWGALVTSIHEAKRLLSSATVFATPKFVSRALVSMALFNASPLLRFAWMWLRRRLPARVLFRVAPRATLVAIPVLLVATFFFPPRPYQLDGNVVTSSLIGAARRARSTDRRDLSAQCDQPARLLQAADLASGRDPAAAIARGRNVVVFLVETLSFGQSSLADPKNETTPFLRELSEYGPISGTARAQIPYSTKAIYSILTGRYASPTLEVFESEVQRLDSLPRTLKAAGYYSAFLSTQYLSWHNIDLQFGAMGFDEVIGADKMKAAAEAGGRTLLENSWGIDDKEFVAGRVLDTLPKDKPFLAVFYNTVSHNPYVYDQEERVGTDLARYRKALRSGDDAFRAIATELKRRGQFDDTVFVMIGDHGDHFTDGKMKVRGCFLSEQSVLVPLVIAIPGVTAPRVEVKDARQIDLVPTLLDLLGVAPDAPLQGRSLLDGRAAPPSLYLNGYGACDVSGIVDGTTKSVYDAYTGDVESFALPRDPDEGSPLAIDGPPKAALIPKLEACSQYNEHALRSLAGQ